jgi:DNA-binding CsgD family transcriptional regulator
LAALCGGHAAELIGVGPAATRLFNRAHNMDPAAHLEFLAMNGDDPARNARIRAGLSAPILRSLTEAEFGDVDAILRTELYAELLRPHGIPFTLQATLMRASAGVVGTSVCYSEKHGLATARERQVFEALTPLVQEAVRLQLTLEGRGARLLAGTMENLGAAVFICNAAGRVVCLTPEAEQLAAAGEQLVLKDRILRPAHPQDAAPFTEALLRAALRAPPSTPPAELPLRSPTDGGLIVCQVVSLPASDFAFGLDASVMVVARTPRDPTRIAPILQGVYGLTSAEAGVVLGLVRGLDIEDVARERGSSAWTVRTQLRAAASKLGVSRQAELVAKLGQL